MNVSIVLDAKNWRHEKSDAKNKMIVYLVEMSAEKPSNGILFFPNNVHLPEKLDSPYSEKAIEVGPNKCHLITCVLKPSTNPITQAQNNIVFGKIAELLLQI